jgi:predicted nucleotidyltransferase
MRLSADERRTIRSLVLRHFGRVPLLFGSRIDDAARGGDIDLLVPTDLPDAEAARRRIALLADLWIALGERKVDVLLDDGRTASPVYERARREGQAL